MLTGSFLPFLLRILLYATMGTPRQVKVSSRRYSVIPEVTPTYECVFANEYPSFVCCYFCSLEHKLFDHQDV